MIQPRMLWMFRPVERSITVSAPQRVAHTIFSTSSAADELTAELPILALIFTRKLRPIAIGSISGWLMFAGMMARPARHLVADEFRRDEGRDIGAEALALRERLRGAFGRRLPAEIFAMRDVDHLLGDDAGARELILRDLLAVRAAPHRPLRRTGRHETRRVEDAVVLGFHGPALDARIAALLDPGLAHARRALAEIDRRRLVRIGARGVVEPNRLLGRIGEHRPRGKAPRYPAARKGSKTRAASPGWVRWSRSPAYRQACRHGWSSQQSPRALGASMTGLKGAANVQSLRRHDPDQVRRVRSPGKSIKWRVPGLPSQPQFSRHPSDSLNVSDCARLSMAGAREIGPSRSNSLFNQPLNTAAYQPFLWLVQISTHGITARRK